MRTSDVSWKFNKVNLAIRFKIKIYQFNDHTLNIPITKFTNLPNLTLPSIGYNMGIQIPLQSIHGHLHVADELLCTKYFIETLRNPYRILSLVHTLHGGYAVKYVEVWGYI